MTRAVKVLHPVITVSDMDSALRFYRDLLGLEVAQEHVHDPRLLEPALGIADGDVRAVILTCSDGTELELAEFRKPAGKRTATKRFEDAGITFVTIVVTELAELVDELEASGFRMAGPIVEHPFPSPVHVVYCFGPDDTCITLAEFVDESPKAAVGSA